MWAKRSPNGKHALYMKVSMCLGYQDETGMLYLAALLRFVIDDTRCKPTCSPGVGKLEMFSDGDIYC